MVDTLILWITVKWRPKLVFSIESLKELFGFGWKLLVSALIDTLYTNIRQLIIGKLYSPNDLAQYNRGRQFPYLFVTNINTSIDSVLLPTMSAEQDDKTRVKAMTRRAIKISTYVMAPLMMGLAFVGKPLVRLLLTEKWLPCVLYMRIFCVTFMFYPIHTANLNAIKAMGRSDMFLKLEIQKKIVGIIALLSTIWISVEAMAYSLLITSVISQIINATPNKKLLDYGYVEQLKDVLPGILLSIVMGVCVSFVGLLKVSDFFILLVQVLLGGIIYLTGSKLLRLEPYEYLIDILKSYKGKGK